LSADEARPRIKSSGSTFGAPPLRSPVHTASTIELPVLQITLCASIDGSPDVWPRRRFPSIARQLRSVTEPGRILRTSLECRTVATALIVVLDLETKKDTTCFWGCISLQYSFTWSVCVLIVEKVILNHFFNSALNLFINFPAAVSCFSVNDPPRNSACVRHPAKSVAFLKLNVITSSADIFCRDFWSVEFLDEPGSTKIRKTTSISDWRSWQS
jgi:hypothetical protein